MHLGEEFSGGGVASFGGPIAGEKVLESGSSAKEPRCKVHLLHELNHGLGYYLRNCHLLCFIAHIVSGSAIHRRRSIT